MHRDRPAATRRNLFNACEPLEARRLLATLSGGILQVNGTSAADVITVALSGGNLIVTTNGSSQSFAASSVTQIKASLGNGDDSITIDRDATTPASLNGEAGDDTLVGGAGGDTLDGGTGNDSLDGGAGDDAVTYASRTSPITATLDLEDHDEYVPSLGVTMSGEPSTRGSGGGAGESDSYARVESVIGGSGDDHLTLVQGVDSPFSIFALGGAGNDTFDSEGVALASYPARLVADGQDGDDVFSYGPSAGTVIGGDGNDTFFNQLSDDSFATVVPGDGNDTWTIEKNTDIGVAIPLGLERLVVSAGSVDVVGNDEANEITIEGNTIATVTGGGGNDTITAATDPVMVDGGSGNDLIYGSAGNDTLSGGSGKDKIIAGDGNDSIRGGSGNDTLYGGAGNDTLSGEADDDALYGGDGTDFLYGGSGNDGIDPGLGNDSIDGGPGGGDAVTYESRSTPVTGTLTASLSGSGSSATRQTALSVTIAGGEIDVGVNVEVLTGSTGDDTLTAVVNDADYAAAATADRSPLIVNGAAGDDSLAFRDAVRNGAGDATPATVANGGAGDDSLSFTRTGSDAAAIDFTMPDDLENTFVSSTAAAKVTGNDGANRIEVQAAHAIVYGGADDDSIYGGGGDDTLYGQDGRDKIFGRAGDDRIDGGNSNDVLRGEDGDDKVYGRDGNDSVSGGEGRDSVYGDAGNDHLNGDGGRDIVYGGGGTDTAPKQSIDRIYKEIELLA